MILFDTTSLVIFLGIFAVVAAVAAVASVAGATTFLTSNRKVRLARHQSIRTYYGRLALHH